MDKLLRNYLSAFLFISYEAGNDCIFIAFKKTTDTDSDPLLLKLDGIPQTTAMKFLQTIISGRIESLKVETTRCPSLSKNDIELLLDCTALVCPITIVGKGFTIRRNEHLL